MKIAVIGGGISGLSIAQCLNERFEVKVFEKDTKPGGLIKCYKINGNLYHRVGGHVFNSKYKEVLDWFWRFFDKETEFTKAKRNAIISMTDGSLVEYPIENHVHQMNEAIIKSFINDLLEISNHKKEAPLNFDDFLRTRFGDTLYNLYFKPYNEKIWGKDLKKVPISWLKGKLPMPTVAEMLFNNFNHINETNMVHNTFYYAKNNGSQFLANRLAEKLDITINTEITKIEKTENKWKVNDFECDKVVFCGNIKDLPSLVSDDINLAYYITQINELEYHGTTSVLCEIEKNPYSWVYTPSSEYLSHRLICTGNFAKSNNALDNTTATIEFTDYISKEAIMGNLKKIPFSPKYIAHHYTEFTYPIQNNATRALLKDIKTQIEPKGLYLLGRFAEWEYYNMDTAILAALNLNSRIIE